MEILKDQLDFFTSIEKSLEEIDSNWKSYKGVLAVGTHSPVGIEEKIWKIKESRENNIPFLGICFGMQLAVIEYCRNVIGILDATSQEFGYKGEFVVNKLPNLRVGIFPVKHFDNTETYESHWHNFFVGEGVSQLMAINGVKVSFTEGILETFKLMDHPFFVGIQWHPEYQSSRKSPHKLLKEFMEVCRETTKPVQYNKWTDNNKSHAPN